MTVPELGDAHRTRQRSLTPLDRQLLDHILEDSLNEIYVFEEPSLRFLHVNRGACRNLGYTTNELRGMTPLSIKPDLTEEDFQSHIQPLRDGTAEGVVFHTHHRRKDGTRYPVEVHLQLARQEQDPVFVAIILDIADRIRLQDQFFHAQKMENVGRLTSGLAHDLNNVLAGVLTGCRLLGRKLERGDKEGAMALATEIGTSVDGAIDMTRHLLDFSRFDKQASKRVDPNQVLDSAEPMLRRLLGGDVAVQISRESTGRFLADPGHIEQAIMNLCVNARDAMPSGGTIRIGTSDVEVKREGITADMTAGAESYVVLQVQDTGCGMSPEVCRKAFEPYFTTKEAGKGTGLGLSTVRQIVAHAEGFVECDCNEGEGTAFRLFFPRCVDEPATRHTGVLSDAAGGSGETVLMVEDETLLRAVVKELLVELGYNPLAAANPEAAIELSIEHEGCIDLVLTDVVLPGMGGVEMVRQLRQSNPEVRVLFMSGFSRDFLVKKGSLEPGTHFLEKPFSEEALARTVRESLEDKTNWRAT